MRGKDRPAALAYLDQQEVLRQVRPALRESALVTTRLRDDWSGVFRNSDRTRVQASTAATRDSARGECARAKLSKPSANNHDRTNLPVRCENEERNALLTTGSWSSALLATQGRGSDTAAGKIAS